MSAHQIHMQRAIALAQRASGCTSPNPLVGAVVVQDGEVVGEGWHKALGQRHAEFAALSVAGDRAIGATLYITLEPCNHHGRTPPCTDAILAAGIKEVIYAVADPNPKAAGGAERLRSQGIKVSQGILETEARHLNRAFFHHLKTTRPWVIAKTASSLDGRVATHSGHSQWITGSQSRQRGHELRQAVDAIIVGCQTVIDDDPALTVRLPESVIAPDSIRHPTPVILDSTGRAPLTTNLLSGPRASETLLITTSRMPDVHRQAVEANGVEVHALPESSDGRPDPSALLDWLGARGVQSVLLEGGPTVHGSFYDADLIDEVWAFIAPMIIGGRGAPGSVAGQGADDLGAALRLNNPSIEQLGDDLLMHGLTHRAGALSAGKSPSESI